jgi:hypothetical protein
MKRITPSPAKHYRLPRYPTRLDVLNRPALLEKHLPSVWSSNLGITGAMVIVVAAGVSACPGSKSAKEQKARESAVEVLEKDDIMKLRSLGYISQPYYTSEEEVQQIQNQEPSAPAESPAPSAPPHFQCSGQ